MAIKNMSHVAGYLSDKGFGRVGVLMGGPSVEREISLKSGRAVSNSLKELNLDVVDIDIKNDDRQQNLRLIKSQNIDCAFLALHGYFGEDGQIQEILDALKIPYTGSGPLASKLAMDKIASRKVLEIYKIPVPKYRALDKYSYGANWCLGGNLNFPLVVKPASGGSSIGVSFIHHNDELNTALDLAFRFDSRVLIEEYIKGRELTVGVLDNQALPVIEIVPKKTFFDYQAKYQAGLTDYIVPAVLEEKIASRVQQVALSVHRLLNCFGCSRIDIILSDDNIPFVLELNSIPGLTETSLLPKAARNKGITFSQLCLRLLVLAYEKS